MRGWIEVPPPIRTSTPLHLLAVDLLDLGDEADVVDLGDRAVGVARREGGLHLPGHQLRGRVADEVAGIGRRVGGDVEGLVVGDAGPRIAGHVADRVPAALAGGEAGLADLTDELGGVGEGDVVDLDVLPRGDVALVERRELLDRVGKGLHLLRADAAERQLHADHLHVGLALAVDALLEAEADELLLGLLARAGSWPPRCRSRRTPARGSGSRGRGRSRRPRGSRGSRSCPCRAASCPGPASARRDPRASWRAGPCRCWPERPSSQGSRRAPWKTGVPFVDVALPGVYRRSI